MSRKHAPSTEDQTKKEGESARFSAGIAALEKLLKTSPSAEELSRTWCRSGKQESESIQQQENGGLRLEDLKKAFDAGRTIRGGETCGRGIPMWIVVRMCKASWHADGTWPLAGADEVIAAGKGTSATHTVARSVHPSSLLLRPTGVKSFQIPTDDGEERKAEPTAEEIAAAYRRRGCSVAEAIPVEDW